MPVEVDVSQRLESIAEATLEIVASGGVDSVTIRAVAQRLDGSTKIITNYLPTRDDLLCNAVEHAVRGWDEERRQAISVPVGQQLRALVLWASTTTGNDVVLRKLFFELLGHGEPGSRPVELVKNEARRVEEIILQATRAASTPDPDFSAKALHLVLRGYYHANLEDSERWNSSEVAPLLERLISLLSRDDEGQHDA